jgi:hypothetical protein
LANRKEKLFLQQQRIAVQIMGGKKSAIRIVSGFGIGLMLSLNSCNSTESGAGKMVEEIRLPQGSNYADLIRNPLSADQETDSSKVAGLEFEYTEFDFGDISDQQIVSHTFNFRNSGKKPLVIAHVRGTCGCTVPHWPKEPIPAGGRGSIQIRFDPSGKSGLQLKPVVITANTLPNQTNLSIVANITPQ